MSKKPYIKIVYPDASPVAMILTEAMVRRASGKRVVETESAEREHAGQDLFAGTLCCVTETSVELTLNLAPEAMDFALATLIAKNLTQPERDRAMATSDSLELDALFAPRAQAAQAPGQALDGESSADVPSAEREAATQSGEQEKKIDVGKISDKELRNILTDMIVSMDEGTETADAIDTAVEKIARATTVSENFQEDDIQRGIAADIATLLAYIRRFLATKKNRDLTDHIETLLFDLRRHSTLKTFSAASVVDFFDRATQIYENGGDDLTSVTNAILNEEEKPHTEEQDIEPGLLNDIEDGTEGGEE